jgi:hypothetical protein
VQKHTILDRDALPEPKSRRRPDLDSATQRKTFVLPDQVLRE